jgi:hypothetical protein
LDKLATEEELEMDSPQGIEKVVSQWFQALNQRNPDLLDEIVDEKNFVDETAFPGQDQGLAGLKQAIAMLKNSAPDYQGEPLDLSIRPAPNGATSVLVTHRGFATLTGTGFMMFAGSPTNEPLKIVGIDEMLIGNNGKIIRHRSQRAPLGISVPVRPAEAIYPALPGGQTFTGQLFGTPRPMAMATQGATDGQSVWGEFTGGSGRQGNQGSQGGQGSGVAQWASGGEGGSTGQGGPGVQSVMGQGAANPGGQSTGGTDPFQLKGPGNQ